MSTSFQPINPYSKPDAPAFAPEDLAITSDPRLALILRKWRDQSTSSGWTFILIAVACAWISFVLFAEAYEFGNGALFPFALLLILCSAVSLWAGVLTCRRSRTGALWSFRLSAGASALCWVLVATAAFGVFVFRLDVILWMVVGAITGGILMPVTSQARRLLDFMAQLDHAGIPLHAPIHDASV